MSGRLAKNNKDSPRVLITGMGMVSALGQGTKAFAQALRTGHSKFAKSNRFPQLSFPVIAVELNDFDFEKSLQNNITFPEKLLSLAYKSGRRAPLTIQTSLVAASEAWSEAQLHTRKIDPTRIGLVIAGNNTTQRYQYDIQTKFQSESNYLSPTYALHFMDTDQVGTLSEVFNIQGEGFSVGGASASGNMAIIQGQRLIEQGLVDVCLIVGVLADLSPIELQGFYNIGALGGRNFQEKPNQACRPFDRDHEGFIWGQASGCLLLESSLTKEPEIPVLGEIVGSGIALDSQRSSEPNAIGESRAMQQALYQAGMNSKDIHYLNTHGSSSALGDEVEVQAIHSVFKESISHVWINSTKSILGHCLWSAGVVEAIATLLQLQDGFVHANLNLENPIDPQLRFVRKQSETADIKTAMSNSFGFGGINTSIVLTRGE